MNDLMRSCAYCGSRQDVTRDHVPPKNVFSKPRPSDLITVPACRSCNSSASKDDEYFRLKLCTSDLVGNHPAAKNNRATIFRSLNRPQAHGLRKSFLSDIHTVQLRTQGGLYLGKRLAFDVSIERIHRVVERTVRGLFFHETSQRLPSDYDVDVHSNDTLREESKEVIEELRRNILIPLAQMSPNIIGEGAFFYRFHIIDEDPFFSVWALTFYGQVPFLALTGPHNRYKSQEK